MKLTLEHAKAAADNPSAYSREELELALMIAGERIAAFIRALKDKPCVTQGE